MDKVRIGENFPVQPRVRVLDVLGKPVPGKIVTAFSWPEPRITGKPSDFLVENNKFAWLDGDESLPSDSNGYAVFRNLKVLGATSNNIYIFFTCDALATAFWGVSLTPSEHVYDLEKFQPPMFLHNTVSFVEIETAPSSYVVEG